MNIQLKYNLGYDVPFKYMPELTGESIIGMKIDESRQEKR